MRRGYQETGWGPARGLRAVRLACALTLLTGAGMARAQTSGLGAERGLDAVSFKPALGGDAFLSLSGLEPPLAGRYHLSVGLDLAEGLMSLKVGDEKIGNLVRRQWTLRLAASYAPTPHIELATELPLIFHQGHGFELLRDELGFVDAEPESTGVGDLRVLGRFHFWARRERPLGLAGSLELRGLTGETESFFGERGLAIIPAVEAELDPVDSLRVVARIGYQFRTKAGRYLNLYQGDEFLIAAGVAWALPVARQLQPELLGEILISSPSRAPFTFSAADALKTPMEFFVGLRGRLTSALSLRLGLGRGLAFQSGFGRESLRFLALVSYRADVSPAPVQAECDVDRDGVPDNLDLCPTVAGLARFDGCPDTDDDEIPDFDDACPQLAGPAGKKGCPPEGALAVFQAGRIVLLGAIRFDSGLASLRPDSSPVLNAVARILREHPELKRLHVDGHTDAQGSADFNLGLSRRRATTVVKYLVAKKIASRRLSARGFGEGVPISDNETHLGRARNRRVVFTVVERDPPAKAPPPDPIEPDADDDDDDADAGE